MSMRAPLIQGIVLCLMLGISACSKSDQSSPYSPRGTPPEGKDQVYQGPLQQAYRSIDEDKHREDCDIKQSAIRNELITALDLQSDALLKQAKKQDKYPENFIPFSNSYLINNPKRTARPGWQDEVYSWEIGYRYYLENKTKNKPGFWQGLDAYVRSLITNDRNRVVYRYNLSLSHDQIEKLPALLETIEACKTNRRCTQPDWSDDQQSLIAGIPAYAHFQKQLDRSRFVWDKRSTLEKFFERIESDNQIHKEDFNDMITHRKISGKDVFSLPIDEGQYSAEDRATLFNIITSAWNSDQFAVTFNWMKKTQSLNLFQFLFEMEPNNRPFVNFHLKQIHLFPFNSIRTVAHEFGHVLGFDDHYYTVWDAKKCEYHSQYNDEDIMSNSDTGEVTAAEWQSLMDRYQYR